LRDLDLWPRRAERQGSGDVIGFKNVQSSDAGGKGGNACYWLDFYNLEGLARYKGDKKKIAGQNVVVELSEEWTFEYCLAAGRLWKIVYEAISGDIVGAEDLPTDAEERAISIYRLIETKKGGKTAVAYSLVQLLKNRYCPEDDLAAGEETPEQTEKRTQANLERRSALQAEFRQCLPGYIVRAIDYLTTERLMDGPLQEVKAPDAVSA
jgi:putative ATP-dependent endonuclease of OLD family